MKFFLIALTLMASVAANAKTDTCHISQTTNFKASYKIDTPTSHHELQYFRLNAQVAYRFPQQGITEVWTPMKNDQAFLIRGFEEDKRSIEYEPIDLKMEKQVGRWSQRKNIIDLERFSFQKAKEVEINGCTLQMYNKHDAQGEISLLWNAQADVLVEYEHKRAGKSLYKYTLKGFEAVDEKNNAVAHVMGFDRTDFADIGDNESDPFFRKMINLGFVSHNEGHIINAQGEKIDMEAHHHH